MVTYEILVSEFFSKNKINLFHKLTYKIYGDIKALENKKIKINDYLKIDETIINQLTDEERKQFENILNSN